VRPPTGPILSTWYLPPAATTDATAAGGERALAAQLKELSERYNAKCTQLSEVHASLSSLELELAQRQALGPLGAAQQRVLSAEAALADERRARRRERERLARLLREGRLDELGQHLRDAAPPPDGETTIADETPAPPAAPPPPQRPLAALAAPPPAFVQSPPHAFDPIVAAEPAEAAAASSRSAASEASSADDAAAERWMRYATSAAPAAATTRPPNVPRIDRLSESTEDDFLSRLAAAESAPPTPSGSAER
jgi:hypothetical protein